MAACWRVRALVDGIQAFDANSMPVVLFARQLGWVPHDKAVAGHLAATLEVLSPDGITAVEKARAAARALKPSAVVPAPAPAPVRTPEPDNAEKNDGVQAEEGRGAETEPPTTEVTQTENAAAAAQASVASAQPRRGPQLPRVSR